MNVLQHCRYIPPLYPEEQYSAPQPLQRPVPPSDHTSIAITTHMVVFLSSRIHGPLPGWPSDRVHDRQWCEERRDALIQTHLK